MAGPGLAALLAIAPVFAQTAGPQRLGQPSRPAAPVRLFGHAAPASAGMPAPTEVAGHAPDAIAPMRVTQGEIYTYVESGVVHYSNQRPAAREGRGPVRKMAYTYMDTCYACALQPGVDFGSIRLNTDAYRREIAAAARDYGVDEALVRAVIHAESAYDPNAVSRVGAQGLMQLMPATARRFGVANVFDIAQNIRGGVQYLAWLLRRFDGNLTLAAAGYNAGEGAVDKYNGVPPYSETQRYVQRVAVLADRYRNASP